MSFNNAEPLAEPPHGGHGIATQELPNYFIHPDGVDLHPSTYPPAVTADQVMQFQQQAQQPLSAAATLEQQYAHLSPLVLDTQQAHQPLNEFELYDQEVWDDVQEDEHANSQSPNPSPPPSPVATHLNQLETSGNTPSGHQVLGNYDSTAMDTDSPSYRRSLMATGYGYRGCSTDCEEKSLSGTDRLRGKRGFEECNMNAPVPSAKPRHYKYDVYPGSTYGKAGVAGALHTSHQLYSPQLSAAEKAVLTIQHLTRGPSRQLEAPGRGSILAALDASNGRVLLAGRELLVRAQSNIANSSSLTPLEVQFVAQRALAAAAGAMGEVKVDLDKYYPRIHKISNVQSCHQGRCTWQVDVGEEAIELLAGAYLRITGLTDDSPARCFVSKGDGSSIVLDSAIWREQLVVIRENKVMFEARNSVSFEVDGLVIKADGADVGIYLFEGDTDMDAESLYNQLCIAGK